MRTFREHLTYANVIATIALFLALGGASIAATHLAKNSVGPKQLKNNAVTTTKIKDGAVDSAKVKDGSLSSADLAPGTVPAAQTGPAGPPGPGLQPATFIDAGLADGEPGCGAHKGFVNFEPATTEHVGYYRSPDGFVQLEGTATQCSPFDGIVFNLPPGYRPLGRVYFPVQRQGTEAPVKVQISSSGEVLAFLPNVETAISLDGISFRCGPAGGGGCP